MHGLNQIHSINAQAVIDEATRARQTALGEGNSVLVKLDNLGFQDFTVKPLVFPTAASLKAHLLATVAVHNQKDWQAYYGRNA
jgi:hypothetical protein